MVTCNDPITLSSPDPPRVTENFTALLEHSASSSQYTYNITNCKWSRLLLQGTQQISTLLFPFLKQYTFNEFIIDHNT